MSDASGSLPVERGRLDALSPREIVSELDRWVIGQAAAKRSVAIALRNRVRRQRLAPEIAADITPKNILMIGPTGVGKTEIARRLAQLSGSPFIKVEASKFTEVGYVGRDVESIVRDLVAGAVDMIRREKQAEVQGRAEERAEERLLDLLLPPPRPGAAPAPGEPGRASDSFTATREKLRAQLRDGQLETRKVEVDVPERTMPSFQILGSQGTEEMDVNFRDLLPGLFGSRTKKRTLPLSEAREVLQQEEATRLVDQDQVARVAVERAESSGIVFLDEMDKIAGRESLHGPDVSREGVQRDLLPDRRGHDGLHEVRPGAHRPRPVHRRRGLPREQADGPHPRAAGPLPDPRRARRPSPRQDLVRILTEPQSALVTQYRALLGTEGVGLTFTSDAVQEIARVAAQVNDQTENIGARRLATVLETVLDEVSFEAGGTSPFEVTIDAQYVRRRLDPVVKNQDLSRFIL